MSNQVLLSQPQVLPSELLSFLIKFFRATNIQVKKAYLAEMHFSASTHSPRTIIAVAISDSYPALSNGLREQLKLSNLRHNGFELVDLLNSPFQQYFSRIEPFFSTEN